MIKYPTLCQLNSHSKVLYNPINLDRCVLALTKPYIGSDKWIDYSGYGNDGTIYGATKDSNGFLSFDGIDDYVDFGCGASLDITKAIAIDMVVKSISNSNTNRVIIGKGGGVDLNADLLYGFRTGWGTKVYPTIRINGHYLVTSSYTLPIGQLTRLTMTFNDNYLTFFVNGQFYDKQNYNGTIDSIPDTSVYMQYPAGDKWNGLIARANIVRRVMSAQEILQPTTYPY